MTGTAWELSESDHQRVLRENLVDWTRGAARQEQPVVVVVAGPPGSGKTTASVLVRAALRHRGGAVHVGADLYKRAHRYYEELLDADVRTAGVRVRADTRRWQEEVEAYARSARLDVVVESALADPANFRAVSAAYRAAGYRVEVVVLAVAEAVSQLGVLQRFLGESAAGGGRYVAWENHDGCAEGLLATLAVVEAEGLADRVTVVRRGLEPLYVNEFVAGQWSRTASAAAVVRAERTRPWSAPQTRGFRRELVRAEVLVHDERLPADRRLAVSRDAERAAAAAEPVRRGAQPLPGPPGTGYHRLSASEHRWVFEELIAPSYLRRATTRPDPTVVYLVGEPGAGQLLAGRMLRRAMRPGTVRLALEDLRGSHPDYFKLVTDSPRSADELVRADAEAWQAEAEACVRERRGDVVIEADFTSAADYCVSAGRFARVGYRIEVVGLATRAADSRQSTLVRHARTLAHEVAHTALPTPAAHARACCVAADIVATAASDPIVSAVTILDSGHRALGRDRWAPWALAAERRRPYTEQEASRFHAVQRALGQAMPRLRGEVADLTVQAMPLMPPPWQARSLEHRPGRVRLPLPVGSVRVLSVP